MTSFLAYNTKGLPRKQVKRNAKSGLAYLHQRTQVSDPDCKPAKQPARGVSKTEHVIWLAACSPTSSSINLTKLQAAESALTSRHLLASPD